VEEEEETVERATKRVKVEIPNKIAVERKLNFDEISHMSK